MAAKTPGLRALLSAFLALVFVAATIPGVMAMPYPANYEHSSSAPDDGCHPEKKSQPTKHNGVFCAGMLSCLGLTAVPADLHLVFVSAEPVPLLQHKLVASGLTLAPDNPPPIF